VELATTFRCVACCLLLSVLPCCSAQEAKIRVINGTNGRPMPRLAVSVSFWYDKKYDKEIPVNYDRSVAEARNRREWGSAIQISTTSAHALCGSSAHGFAALVLRLRNPRFYR
jgi:hypothetical protein